MKLITGAALLVALMLTWVLPAAAANVQVSGTQTVVDAANGVYSMEGSLVGDWYITSFACHETPAGERWPCTGTELFMNEDGWLEFEFEFTASASGNGRCQHTIVGGGGIYAGASGVITMKDRPTAAGLVTTYKGHIDY